MSEDRIRFWQERMDAAKAKEAEAERLERLEAVRKQTELATAEANAYLLRTGRTEMVP